VELEAAPASSEVWASSINFKVLCNILVMGYCYWQYKSILEHLVFGKPDKVNCLWSIPITRLHRCILEKAHFPLIPRPILVNRVALTSALSRCARLDRALVSAIRRANGVLAQPGKTHCLNCDRPLTGRPLQLLTGLRQCSTLIALLINKNWQGIQVTCSVRAQRSRSDKVWQRIYKHNIIATFYVTL
jgi:hypothetical protein